MRNSKDKIACINVEILFSYDMLRSLAILYSIHTCRFLFIFVLPLWCTDSFASLDSAGSAESLLLEVERCLKYMFTGILKVRCSGGYSNSRYPNMEQLTRHYEYCNSADCCSCAEARRTVSIQEECYSKFSVNHYYLCVWQPFKSRNLTHIEGLFGPGISFLARPLSTNRTAKTRCKRAYTSCLE
jgi:hypothetical protein